MRLARRIASKSATAIRFGKRAFHTELAMGLADAYEHASRVMVENLLAADAQRIGLVNRVVPAGEERAEAMRLAQRIASKSAHAIRIGKQAFHAQLAMGLADAYEHASRVMVENLFDTDAQDGIGAFLAKRPPQWGD